MACWVYVLSDSRGRYYTGITKRLRTRIIEHDAGRTRADAGRGPFKLVYKEKCKDYAAARIREKFLKSGAGREWLQRTLAEDQESEEV